MDGHAIVVGRLPGVALPKVVPESTSAQQPPRSVGGTVARSAGQLALNCVFAAMVLSAAIMIGPALLGFHRYVILTGSMTGTYDRGSIVFDRPTPVADLKVGDPITYSPPPGFTSHGRITHRIWWIGRGANGERVFQTKGDANKHPDAWKFTLDQATQDRVVFHIPEVGYLFSLLSIREFRIVLIGLPALIIGLMMLRSLWRDGGEEARRRKLAELGWQTAADESSDTTLSPVETPDTDPQPVWVELQLQAVRPGSPPRAAASRIPSDPSGTLHVRRLVSSRASGRAGGALRCGPDLRQPARIGSKSTSRLQVRRLRSSSRTGSSKDRPHHRSQDISPGGRHRTGRPSLD